MTLAGTRPPTVDEWDKYELHHRARLATKPGLTGMWQVSGRSNITDFDEFYVNASESKKKKIKKIYEKCSVLIALYDIDSEQFVNLIRYAKYICTDSFHCTVFSILHHALRVRCYRNGSI